MAEKPLDEKTLETMIEELRRMNDWVDHAYQRVKTKTLTFLGGGLAVLTFLYSNGETFIPTETYGRIFYFCGLGAVLGAIIMLFAALLPRMWEFSIESKDIDTVEKYSGVEYLKYVKDRLFLTYRTNIETYDKNQRLLNRSFYPLVFGAIILVVLKIFGA